MGIDGEAAGTWKDAYCLELVFMLLLIATIKRGRRLVQEVEGTYGKLDRAEFET
jgi:hypothetical protein